MTAAGSSAVARAKQLHARGVAATAAARPASGARLHRAGLRLLGWPGPAAGPLAAALSARLLISLAFAESELGRTELGLDLLASAEALAAPADLGVLLQQRGLLLMRTGRTAEVLPLLDAAVPLLSGPEHTAVLMRTLLNRGVLLFASGRIALARADLNRSRELALRSGAALVVAKAVHNLGVCELLAGDIPAALAAYAEAESGYREAGPGWLPHLSRERASVLLAAGLAREATAELDAAIAEFRRHRLSHELAEAELAAAQAALMAGELAVAARWAAAAQRRFRRRGNHAWAALAELTRLRVSWGPSVTAPRASAAAAQAVTAVELAQRLRKLGLPDDAALADWLAVRALLAAGQVAQAQALAAELPAVRSGAPVENRLLHRLAAAELAAAEGQRGVAFRQLRTGLTTLHQHRSRLGSADLQAGTAALGVRLARTGLQAALDDGSPRLVYDWSERARAQAFRIRPVRPPADREVAEAVAELRALRGQAREAELAGGRDPAALRRCAELERWITRRNWQVRGSGQASAAAGFGELSAALGDRTLVSLMSQHGRLVALVLRAGTARMVSLGSYEVAAEAERRLRSDLDALAGRRLPERMAAVVHASLRRQVSTLSAELLAPLRGVIGDTELILVPTMALTALPWGLLPDLRGRPVTVAPSATAWLAATRARTLRTPPATPTPPTTRTPPAAAAASAAGTRSAVPTPLTTRAASAAGTASAATTPATTTPVGTASIRSASSTVDIRPGQPTVHTVTIVAAGSGASTMDSPVLVAGPGLAHAIPEVQRLAGIYPGARQLAGAAATVPAALAALDGVRIAHFATHGHHDRENVLFSRLDLADGPLMAYDLQQLAAPPEQVVLSACDVGRAVVRPGDELLGFTAALLYAGVAGVVSAVTRVPDEDAIRVMTAFHRALAAGVGAAAALATAAATEQLSSFVCFGSG